MTSATGTLPETQVQAMFDRIARVYDRLNTVMTAGLDRRWRRRAADLARVAPGDPVAGRGHRHGRPGGRAAPSGSGPDARVVGLDFSEGMLELARVKAPAIEFVQGSALELPYADGEFAAATVGFGARNFADLGARAVRDGPRGAARRPGGGARDHHAPAAPAVVVLPALVRPRRAGARSPGGRLRRLQLPAQLGAPVPRGRRRSAAELAAAGLVDVGWVLTAGGIIALHHGTVRAGARREHHPGHAGVRAGRGRARAGPGAGADRGAPGGDHRGPRLRAGRPRLGHACGGRQATASRGGRAQRRRGRRGDLGRRRGGAAAHGHARARRRPGRRPPAPRRAHRVRGRRAGRRHGHGRPAVLARVRRAGLDPQRAGGPGAVHGLLRAGPRRADAARGRVVGHRHAPSATWSGASSRPPACSPRPPAWAPCSAMPRPRPATWRASAAGSGWRSRSWTTCSTCPGPAERTGKHRGTDLLDGTVTLPLIIARERDPELAGMDLAAFVTEPAQADAVCERIARTGALGSGPRAGAGLRGRGQGRARRDRTAGRPAGRARPGGRRRRRAVRLGGREALKS